MIGGLGCVQSVRDGQGHTAQTRPSICTVSTVFDTPGNVERFVQRNLAAGVDHMFVFLDRPQPEVSALLSGQSAVTTIVTDRDYWAGRRPGSLNRRQVVNANLVRLLLAPLPWAEWLFHIDGDECLDVDRARLLALDRSVRTVQLQCLEAVSSQEGADAGLFKRKLPPEDLCLLNLLGVIEYPENWSLFQGHLQGKVGIRPSLDHHLHIHRARTDDGEIVQAFEADFLRLLHYNASSFADFRHKWGTHLDAAVPSVWRQKGTKIRAAYASVVRNPGLDDAQKEHYLLGIYRRAVEDDVATLGDLGFLETPSPDWHRHAPEPLADADADAVRALLDLLRAADKDYFIPRKTDRPASELMRSIAQQLPAHQVALASAVQGCVPVPARPGPGALVLSRLGAPGRKLVVRTARPLRRVAARAAAAARPTARRLRRAVRGRATPTPPAPQGRSRAGGDLPG